MKLLQHLKEIFQKDTTILLQEIKELKELTTKQHNIIMATLTDFQNLANEINTATQNISAYVQGAGMSAADQDTALQSIQTAVSALTAAVPAQPAQEPTTGQPA